MGTAQQRRSQRGNGNGQVTGLEVGGQGRGIRSQQRAVGCALEVGYALEDDRPEVAAALSLDAATDLINQRNRPSYAEAARLLTRARALYRRTGRTDEWGFLIGEIRDATKTLRAFRDEMKKAGL